MGFELVWHPRHLNYMKEIVAEIKARDPSTPITNYLREAEIEYLEEQIRAIEYPQITA